MKCNLEWNVFVESINERKIIVYNILSHPSLINDIDKQLKKSKKRIKDGADVAEEAAEFIRNLQSFLMYRFWSKCEWEVVIDQWVGSSDNSGIKVDAYDQIMMNWHPFVEYMMKRVWKYDIDIDKAIKRAEEKKNEEIRRFGI